MNTICNNCETPHPLLSQEEKHRTSCKTCNSIMHDSYDETINNFEEVDSSLASITELHNTITELICQDIYVKDRSINSNFEAVHIQNALEYNRTLLGHLSKKYRHRIENLNVVLVKGFAGGVNTSDFNIKCATESALKDICTVIERNITRGVITYVGHDGDDYNSNGHTLLVDTILQMYNHTGAIQPITFKLPGKHDTWKESWPSKCNNWEILSPSTELIKTWGKEPWTHLSKWGIESIIQKDDISPNSIGIWTMGGWTTTCDEFHMFHSSSTLNQIPWFLYEWYRTVCEESVSKIQHIKELIPTYETCFDEFNLDII